MTPDGKFAGAAGDFRAQATQCFENLKAALAAVDAGFEHVAKFTCYFVDMAHLPLYFEVRDRYVDTKAPPAIEPPRWPVFRSSDRAWLREGAALLRARGRGRRHAPR